jgi:hypothetical protein
MAHRDDPRAHSVVGLGDRPDRVVSRTDLDALAAGDAQAREVVNEPAASLELLQLPMVILSGPSSGCVARTSD